MTLKTLSRLFIVSILGAGVTACQTAKVEIDTISGPKIGMVLMHGKGGATQKIDSLADALRGAGVLVETPLMPWSRKRIYAKTYEDPMGEIDAAVNRLKAKGAKRIVVGGHSLGANAALGYGARRDGLAGVILLAYGHVPSGRVFPSKLGSSIAKAKAMIDAGNGMKTAGFGDLNQGRTPSRSVRADIYYSWFAPDGPASDKNNAGNVKNGTPVLWVSGTQDRVSKFGKGLIYSKIPSHPKSNFVVIQSNHINTPRDSVKTVSGWLRGL